MSMILSNKFNLGDTVFLKTDKDQLIRIVTAIKLCSTGPIYYLGQGVSETQHYEMEVSDKINELLKVG